MKAFHSLVLLSAGGLVLSLCSVAARADSIPTLTATSVSYSIEFGVTQWTIAGDSFSVSGGGGALSVIGSIMPGQSFGDVPGWPPIFGNIFGSGPNDTTGYLTIGGASHYVDLLDLPSFSFPADEIYNPSFLPPLGSSRPGASGRIFSGAASVIGTPGTAPFALRELFCNSPSPALVPGCTGNWLAEVNINVSGIATLHGYGYPNDPYDTITSIDFTTTPEPVSAGLAGVGLTAMLTLLAYGKGRLG